MLIGYYDYINEAKKEDFAIGGHVYCDDLRDYAYAKNVAEITKVSDKSIEIHFDKDIYDEKKHSWSRNAVVNDDQFRKLIIIKPADVAKFKAGNLIPYESSKRFKSFMKVIGFKRTIDYADISFFDIDKESDELVSYVTAQKHKQYHYDDMYFSKFRQTMRVGRFLKKFNPTLTDVQIEKMVHEYKANWNTVIKDAESRLKVVTGEDIRFWYLNKNYSDQYGNNGTLANSCMKYKRSQKRFDIYCDNPDKIAMAILLDDKEKLLARALIWRLDEPEGKIYMDRIYFADMACKNIIANYGKKNNMLMYDDLKETKMKVYVKKDYGDEEGNPYMDTFKYFYEKKNMLTNMEKSGGSFTDYKYYTDND